MSDSTKKILSFRPAVPSKADYQPVKSNYTIREIKQLFGLSERTIRRWTEAGIIQATPSANGELTYDFQALTQFRRVRELRSEGRSIKQIEAELQGQMNLFRTQGGPVARLLSAFEEALALHEQGDTKASEFYSLAIDEGDNVAEAYCNLGILEVDQGEISHAIDNFTLSLKNDPRHVEAHYNLANLYYDAGDLPLARLHYEAAAKIEPNFSLAFYNLALVNYRLNRIHDAAEALAKYRELEPDDRDINLVDELLRAWQGGQNRER